MPKILKKKKTASEIVAAARGLKKVTANELIDGIFDDFLNFMVIANIQMMKQL